MKLSRRSTSLALAALSAGGLVVWLAWPEERNLGVAVPTAEWAPVSSPSESTDESLAPILESTAVPREEAALAPSGAVTAQEAESDPKVARVRVLVRSKDDGSPLPAVQVAVEPGQTEHEGLRSYTVFTSSEATDSSVTDAQGRAELEVESGKSLVLLVQRDRYSSKVRRLDALNAGESVEVIVEFATREDIQLYGQLVDVQSGSPLLGDVTLEHGGKELRSVETDASGLFRISAGSWEQAIGSARAVGYGRIVFAIEEGHENPADPLIVQLSRAATLEANVCDSAGVPIRGAQVSLSTDAHHIRQSGSFMFGFYANSDPTWSGRTDAAGKATVPDLAPNVPLKLSTSAGGLPTRHEPDPLVLEPGELRSIEIVLGTGASIVGALVDQNGTPIPYRQMWCTAAEWRSQGTFNEYSQPVQQVWTDTEGKFRFEALPIGTWWIGPAAMASGQADGIPPLATPVTVESELAEIQVIVRVPRGLFLRGVVLDSAGNAAFGCSVYAVFAEGSALLCDETDEHGEFSLGPLAGGKWTISARGSSGPSAPSEDMVVEAGQTGIVLELRKGGGISGEVVDSRTGERCECDLILTSTDPESWMRTFLPDGILDLQGLLPRSYAVTARTSDGRIGVARGIVVEREKGVENLRVEVAPGSKLELRNEGTAQLVHCELLVDGVEIGAVDLRGTQTGVAVVPAGTIDVEWKDGPGEGTTHTQRIEVGRETTAQVSLRVDG